MSAPFSRLSVGATFTFAAETEIPGYQGVRGPWVKVGSRSYRAIENGYASGPTHKVGTDKVRVSA